VTTPPLPTAEQWRRWGIDPAWSRTVEVPSHDGGQHRWHLLDHGPVHPGADASVTVPTIVCVHGNPTWSYLWSRVVERLGEHHRVVAVDQLGMGFSERCGHRPYATRVRDLADVVTALGIDGPVVVVGQDWGGAVAMGWAVDHPSQLVGMVLCNTGIAVPVGRKAPWLIRLAASGPMTDLVGRRTRIFVDGTIGLSWRRLEPAMRQALRAPYRSAELRPSIAEFVADVPFTTAHPSSAALADVADRLSQVRAPVLLVWGANDPVFDDSFALDLAARMPHAARHRFAHSGHLSPLESDVAGIIEAWLPAATVPTGAPAAEPGPTVSSDAFDHTWAALVARRHDTSVAVVDGSTGQRVTFAELHDRVMAVAGGLAARGVRPGDRVAMLVPPGIDLVTAVYAVWRAGGVTVIADRGLGLRGLGRAVRGAHVQWVLGEPKAIAASKVMRWAPRASTIPVGSFAAMITASASPPVEPSPHDEAAVLYTSGATGPAKGVRYRHRQLAAQRDALARTYRITADDRLVAAFAPFALYGPALGIASTIPDVDVTAPGTLTADALAASVEAIDATIVFASPAALTNVLRTGVPGDARLGTVRLVLSAGAPVPVATLRAMAERCPVAELHTPYGMTECLPVADTSLVDIDRAGAGAGVFVGTPVPGAQVLVAPLGFDTAQPVAPVAAGTTGELLVRAPWCSDGYDQLWATQHDARPVDHAGVVWHRSGDVGHIDADGCVWVEGRSVHVIHTVTGPVTPVPVEVAVERLDGIQRCAAAGVGPVGCQQLVVVVERAGGDGLADDATAAAVRGAIASPVAAVLQVSALPVDIRHNTKIDRTAVAAWAAEVLGGGRARRPW
jgi:acyl-coenzyme A synthetase/AMP-(fatty) acid ligase/pimeloyl-ACP methyl ester carboxylesterase